MDKFSDTINPRMAATAQIRESAARPLVRPVLRYEQESPQARMHLPLRSMRRDFQYLLQTFRTSAALWIADLLALSISLLLSASIGPLLDPGFDLFLLDLAIPLIPALTLVGITLRLYPGIGLSSASELRLTTIAATLVFGVFLIATNLQADRQADNFIALTCAYLGCLLGLPIFRSIARRLASGCAWWKQPALIFGGTEEGARAYRTLLEHPQLGLQPIGLLDDLPHHWRDTETELHWYLGQFRDASIIAEQRNVFWGIVAMSDRNPDDVATLLDHISTSIPNLLILPAFAKAGREWDGAHHYGNSLGARCTEMLLLPIPRFIKRTIDLIFGIAILLVLLPLMVAIAMAIKITSPGKIFYRQTVLGLAGRQFSMWKFRTMHVNAQQILTQWLAKSPELSQEWERHHKLRNDPRVTAIGKLLRRTSLDELPQLFNVLLGDMSLVGPRPYPLYECEEMQFKAPLVLRIRPGITGLWQVSGRSNMTFEERLVIDTKYVRNWSVWADFSILAKTLIVVIQKNGAY